MSGTSMDAVDAALVDISRDSINLIDYRQYPINAELNHALKSITGDSSIELLTRLDVRLGRLFADAATALMHANNLDTTEIVAIGCHGQTLLHRPELPEPTTLQVGDPNIIAHTTGVTTVADFRRMDLAAGGQGAPLASVLHIPLFRHPAMHRGIVNIGGMANITVLPPFKSKQTVSGFDTGPGNVLLDAWANRHTGQSIDINGNWAAAGAPDPDLLGYLLKDDYFQQIPPKSTGRDYFNLGWLQKKIDGFKRKCPPENVQATLVQLTAVSIANAFHDHAPATQEVIVCGGGVHNPLLMQELARTLTSCNVKSTAELGINPDAMEAMAFAWLARCRLEGIAGNLPSVTGASGPVLLGGIYAPRPQR